MPTRLLNVIVVLTLWTIAGSRAATSRLHGNEANHEHYSTSQQLITARVVL
jgi:hypothetical protein